MPNRKITVELTSRVSPREYARLANAIWSMASLHKSFVQVRFDGKASAGFLNKWYEKDAGKERWEDDK